MTVVGAVVAFEELDGSVVPDGFSVDNGAFEVEDDGLDGLHWFDCSSLARVEGESGAADAAAAEFELSGGEGDDGEAAVFELGYEFGGTFGHDDGGAV